MIRASLMSAPSAMGKLVAVLEGLARVPRRVAVIAAPQITRELRMQYRKGLDPYGQPWAKLRPATLKKHGPPPLTDSGVARDGTVATVRDGNRAGIHIRLGAQYLYFAQVGFRVGKTKVKPRRILPQHGMPARWREILKASARQALQDARSGGGR